MSSIRPRRSVLYLPASNERALEKAKELPVDALILDLEDAVAPEGKATARELACAAAVSDAYGMRELTIRVNGLGSPWHEEDLSAVCAAAPDGIVVPKVGMAREVRSLAVMGARAAGVAVWDGVYNDVRETAGFEEECRQGRELGFDGKTLIHPGKVEAANRTFAPSGEEVERARVTRHRLPAALWCLSARYSVRRSTIGWAGVCASPA